MVFHRKRVFYFPRSGRERALCATPSQTVRIFARLRCAGPGATLAEVKARCGRDGAAAGDRDCQLTFFAAASKLGFVTKVSPAGLLALYATFVLWIGFFVSNNFRTTADRIIRFDLSRVYRLVRMIDNIYMARALNALFEAPAQDETTTVLQPLELEEELYRELIDVYRQPKEIFKRTGPYKHWYGADTQETPLPKGVLRGLLAARTPKTKEEYLREKPDNVDGNLYT